MSETCKGCADEQAPEPGPVLFKVKPQGAGHQDSAWVCERHLATMVNAYGRACVVTPVRLPESG